MRRRRLFLPVVVLLVLVGAGLAAVQWTQARARLLVQFPDGRVETRNITFRNTMSGLEMLQRSGLTVVTSKTDFGTAVCSIEGVGCPATNCFCDKANFWGYYHWTAQGWAMADVGADQATVTNGGLDGWRWGDGPPTVNGGANRPTTPAGSAATALNWLRARQQADGSFASETFRVGLTLDVVLAASAAGEDVGAWRTEGGRTVLDFLAAGGAAYLDQGGAREAGKLLAGVVAAGGQPHAFGGRNLVQAVQATYHAGRFGQSHWDQAWAILGLAAAGEVIPDEAVQTLLAAPTPEGGWAFAPGMGEADVDTTGLALQALAAASAPHDHPSLQNARLFLSRQQNDDGGFPAHRATQTASRAGSAASPSNAPSTALAVMGLLAIGTDPLAPGWQKGGRTPLDALLALQGPDGGLRGAAGPNDVQATAQALPALLGKVYPLRGPRD
ncbi:MAG: terpene cyclase/mutase family protein [Anaerolineae bacterium]|nr:terpene cyclase/mutase family protein [Anaerolineae bacterium]